MLQAQTKTQAFNTEATTSVQCPDLSRSRVPCKVPKLLWKARFLDAAPLRRLRTLWQIWCRGFRSLCGHIEMQSSTASLAVDLGPVWDKLPDGSYRENARTAARSRCIESLLAKCPWVDSVDLRMFLDGFDAGAEFSHPGKAERTQAHCS
jgi:hypothetical protein